MSDVNINYEVLTNSAAAVLKSAASSEDLCRDIDKLIDLIRESWQGTGATEYISFLESLKSDIAKRATDLHDISSGMNKIIRAAREADEAGAQGTKRTHH